MPGLLTDALAALGVALRADVNALEIILLLGVMLAVRRGWMGSPRAWRPAFRPATAVATVALLAVGLRLALLPALHVPHPGGSDEFSHVLLGDTLAHGRLTNPAHPMWVHFETRHVLHQPTYNSMYFPGQGLFLAFGQALFGEPWVGVLLSTAALCGALTWMLLGWFPASWALAGGLLAILRIGLTSYWVNSFWGGSIAALGGALALGACARLARARRVSHALLLAAGLVLMALTRPFEGLAFSLPLAVWLLVKCRARLWRIAVPVALVLGLAGAGLAVYFRAVTGSATLLPYQVNQRTYGWPMTLAWQDPPQVEHRHKELRDYYQWELAEHQRLKAPGAAAVELLRKGVLLWSFFLGPALTFALLAAPASLGSRKPRLALWAGGATLAATLLEQSSYPHYVSPATGVIYVLVVNALRYLARHRPGGAKLARAVFAIVVAAVAFRLAARPLGVPLMGPQRQMSWCCASPAPNDRWPFERQLRATPGRHLVLVRYGPSNRMRLEWVYNEAGIDASKIVWARDLGEAANRELLAYYPDRRVWLGEPDAVPPRVRPY
ncbi:MAG: hypothetical protein HY822_01170 [Acidobacteria bacterium]|nr:hypothetical protein [Acidobacteriota bacterium]